MHVSVSIVGVSVGALEGLAVGLNVGALEGLAVGASLGGLVGDWVGAAVICRTGSVCVNAIPPDNMLCALPHNQR